MALDAGTPEATPEVAAEVVVEAPIEQPTEPLIAAVDDETPVSDENPAAEPVEPAATEDPDNKDGEAPVEAATEPIVFDHTAEDFDAKITETLEKYDLADAPELKAVIDALNAKIAAAPTTTAVIPELADYGAPEDIKVALVRESHLSSVRKVGGNGDLRPNTDIYVAELAKVRTPTQIDWLHHDLSALPSAKYRGLNKMQENIADAVAVEGDTVGTVLERYEKAIAYARSEFVPNEDVPAYIVESGLTKAYRKLSADSRAEYDAYSPDLDRPVDGLDANGDAIQTDEYGNTITFNDAAIRARKLNELAKMAKGFEYDESEQQKLIDDKKSSDAAFASKVQATQKNFYDGMKQVFAQDVLKNVVFSTNPAAQKLAAFQNVALLTQAFNDPTVQQALKEAGVNFDPVKAEALVDAVETASVELVVAQEMVDADGNQLNEPELKRATRAFETITREWKEFADDIIKQQAKVVSNSKEADIKDAVEKIKIAPKARIVAKGVGSPSSKKEVLPPVGTMEWDKYWAKKIMDENAAKARPYQTA